MLKRRKWEVLRKNRENETARRKEKKKESLSKKKERDGDKAVQRQKKKRQIGLLYGAALDSLMFGEF